MYAVGQPFPSLPHLLGAAYLLSTSQPSYLTKVSCADSSFRGAHITVISSVGWLGHGVWHVVRHYRVSIRVLMRLAPEQSKETFLEQKGTVQT